LDSTSRPDFQFDETPPVGGRFIHTYAHQWVIISPGLWVQPEISALLKQAIVLMVSSLVVQEGFWSTFLAPKKTGDCRPILNLKPLNKYIKPAKFRMETLA